MTLPQPLGALSEYPQFVLWKLIQYEGEPKPRKVPVDMTGRKIDAHNPANWMTHDVAYATALASGFSVGFVFTAADPFWFLDIDACGDGQGNWSELANTICALFQGAAIEVSQSNMGLHIFGWGAVPPGYKTKNKALGLEIYSQKRFVALGHSVTGDITAFDWTAHLAGFVPGHFELNIGGDLVPVEWTVAARPECTSSEDDDELIAKMMNSRSAGNMFGGTATVQQLWNNDTQALAEFFPDPEQGRPYDASSADMALATHLSFWTGANCERMERLMRRSGLVRDKWEIHPTYLKEMTIIKAATRCKNVYTAVSTTGNQGGVVATQSSNRGGYDALATIEDQEDIFRHCVYVVALDKIFEADTRRFLKPEQFNKSKKYSGRKFLYTYEGKDTKKATEAFTMNQLPNNFLQADDIWFRPDLPAFDIRSDSGVTYLNTYTDPKVPVTNGDVTPWLDWFERFIPNDLDRHILMNYMAALVQYQGKKFFWCPVVIGAPGNGKGLLSAVIKYAIGGPEGKEQKYCYTVASANLDDGGLKFNLWLENRIFVEFDEIHTGDRHGLVEALKPYITNQYLEVQGKGSDQHMGYNCANYWAWSNHLDAIQKTRDDRRYAVVYTGQQSEAAVLRDMPGDYLPEMWEWLDNGGYEAMGGYLRAYKLDPKYNPAGKCHRAPKTSCTDEAIGHSLGVVEQEVVEWIGGGRPGFRNGWISSNALDIALTEAGLARRVGQNKRALMLAGLEYIPHPGLPDGRSPQPVLKEGDAAPKLYRHSPSLTEVGMNPAEIFRLYCLAQGYTIVSH